MQSELNQDEKDHALASELAYNRNMHLPPGYEKEELDDHSVVLHRPDHTSIIAYRGTKGAADWLTNLGLVHDYFRPVASHRLAKSKRQAQEVMKRHSNRKFTITGHSLGGSIADYVANETNTNAHVFNPFVPGARKRNKGVEITAHIRENDPVSLLYGGKNVVKKQYKCAKGMSMVECHRLKNYLS